MNDEQNERISDETLQTTLEALESQYRYYWEQLEREPKTRGGEPNPRRLRLIVNINSISAARNALASEQRARKNGVTE